MKKILIFLSLRGTKSPVPMFFKKILLPFTFFFLLSQSLFSQVKIGDNPNTINANSLLELESTNKGFLPPRVAISNIYSVTPLTSTTPAGMLVYSSGGAVTDGYYTWSGTKWLPITTGYTRSNFVLVKSAADLPAPVGGVITLASGVYYEVNGTVTLTSMINLNGCNINGVDPVNDKLVYTGAGEMFTGAGTGGIRYLTLTASAGKVFNISAAGANKNLLVQNSYFIGCSSIGTIQGVGGTVYFASLGFFFNTSGITFQNCTNVVLNTTLWDSSNSGTYEKFVGTFSIIQILGGDRLANSSAVALNISGITSLSAGSIKVVMFVGTGTYVSGTFTNAWEVESSGLNTEKDDVAAGNLYISTAATTTIATTGVPVKVAGTTTAVNLFRVSSPANNRLTYTGTKAKRFQAICSLTAIQPSNNRYFSFYIAKNGVVLPESRQEVKIINSTDQGPVTLSCMVPLSPNDYIEVWVENETSNTDLTVQTMNLAIK